jgi:hypothetical protein
MGHQPSHTAVRAMQLWQCAITRSPDQLDSRSDFTDRTKSILAHLSSYLASNEQLDCTGEANNSACAACIAIERAADDHCHDEHGIESASP